MKYMLLMNVPRGGPYQIADWPAADITAHIAFMRNFAKKLSAAGELVAAEGLGGPDQAKLVRAGAGGEPITDGVFPEAKEFLAGYWVVDVDTPERAYAIAAEASAAPGPGGTTIESRDRSAAGHERPDVRLDTGRMIPRLDDSAQDLLRDLAPTVLCTLVRRYRDFGGCEDAVQEALHGRCDAVAGAGNAR